MPIEAWIIDDTGLPKKGRHSVGVGRQYCGQVGKQDNCQVAVSLSIANRHASLPVAYRLYLPEDWAEDGDRRRKAGVPEEIGFKTKPEIALEQLRWACEAGIARGVVLMDAGYGCNTNLRTSISALALRYVAGILSQTSACGCRVRDRCRRRNGRVAGDSRSSFAATPSINPSRSSSWRSTCPSAPGARCSGGRVRLNVSSRFARVRVRAAHHDYKLTDSRPEEWLLIEWPKGEKEPTKYWLSTLRKDITFRALVDLAKLRWRIGVSSEGHAVMSVKVRPEPKNSGFEAREAPWRESKTAEPSDNMLERSVREASGCNVQ